MTHGTGMETRVRDCVEMGKMERESGEVCGIRDVEGMRCNTLSRKKKNMDHALKQTSAHPLLATSLPSSLSHSLSLG